MIRQHLHGWSFDVRMMRDEKAMQRRQTKGAEPHILCSKVRSLKTVLQQGYDDLLIRHTISKHIRTRCIVSLRAEI
jgi:hypothetical protein